MKLTGHRGNGPQANPMYLIVPPFPFPCHTNAVPCGGSFSSEQGEIISPKWPADYPAQSVCTWRISIPSAGSVHVAFTHFELQAINVLGDCVDYVELFNQNMTSLGRSLSFKVSCVCFVFVSMFSFISGEKTICSHLFFQVDSAASAFHP